MAGLLPILERIDKFYEENPHFVIVDRLNCMARDGDLKDEDWARIEALALELQAARLAEAKAGA